MMLAAGGSFLATAAKGLNESVYELINQYLKFCWIITDVGRVIIAPFGMVKNTEVWIELFGNINGLPGGGGRVGFGMNQKDGFVNVRCSQ